MKAEIIAVGSELLTSNYLDTNSLFLTEKLNEAGFEVHLKTVVGDSEENIGAVLRSALTRSKLIIFSGGLGPTEDDLTRSAVARVLGRRRFLDPGVLEGIREKFASRGYVMTSINERQAEVIEGAEILENHYGTAPGMWLEEGGVYLALLPGPPREIQPMMQHAVLPRVQPLSGLRRMARRSLRIVGMTESEVDSKVAPIYKTYGAIQTTILAGSGHVALHFTQWIERAAEPSALEELVQRVHETLGTAIFTSSEEALEEVTGRLLRDSGHTVAVAESCTSGLLAARITRVPGSSQYFLGGALCYSNAAKTDLCGVAEELIGRHGAVSAEVACALAEGVRARLKSSLGISVTGIAGPDGGSTEKPVGLVYVGISDGSQTRSMRRILPGAREVIRDRAASFALSVLRDFLIREKR